MEKVVVLTQPKFYSNKHFVNYTHDATQHVDLYAKCLLLLFDFSQNWIVSIKFSTTHQNKIL
jgi:hypothetical protein